MWWALFSWGLYWFSRFIVFGGATFYFDYLARNKFLNPLWPRWEWRTEIIFCISKFSKMLEKFGSISGTSSTREASYSVSVNFRVYIWFGKWFRKLRIYILDWTKHCSEKFTAYRHMSHNNLNRFTRRELEIMNWYLPLNRRSYEFASKNSYRVISIEYTP